MTKTPFKDKPENKVVARSVLTALERDEVLTFDGAS